MNEVYVTNIIQSAIATIPVALAFFVPAWKYVTYQAKRDNEREVQSQINQAKQEDHIKELMNGERVILVTCISENTKALVKNSDSLDRFARAVHNMPCAMGFLSKEEDKND